MNARHYRNEAYRLHSHPSGTPSSIVDKRDSMKGVYSSLVPFMGLELFIETSINLIPAGLVFPMGFLLFWAFFYTYYRPGSLEARLSQKDSWRPLSIPSIILSAVIWFIKVTIVELGELIFFRAKPSAGAQQPRAQKTAAAPVAPRPQFSQLPYELRQALKILGIPESRNWDQIHRRYRELAKMYHPDLNPEVTEAGNRFMVYDCAYKTLSVYRLRYFSKRVA